MWARFPGLRRRHYHSGGLTGCRPLQLIRVGGVSSHTWGFHKTLRASCRLNYSRCGEPWLCRGGPGLQVILCRCCATRFLPIRNTPSPISVVLVMRATMGALSLALSSPTPAETTAPMLSCRNPSNAEALPAFLLKGAIAIAAAFG